MGFWAWFDFFSRLLVLGQPLNHSLFLSSGNEHAHDGDSCAADPRAWGASKEIQSQES